MEIGLEIEMCLDRYRQKLQVIDSALTRALEAPIRQRPRTLIAFLWKERAVYSFAIGELEHLRSSR